MRLTLFLWLISAGYLHAQNIEASLIDNRVILDGKLNEEVWKSEKPVSGFRQLFPSLSDPAVNATEVRILYDQDAIYVGIENTISSGGRVFGTVLERDQPLDSDDYVEIIIDTYNDKTNALAFRTNPLGNRFDYEIADNGASMNTSWNTFWDVATSVTLSGWTAEYRIPFSSLRYKSSEAITMGIKIIRQSKWNNERVIYPLNNPELDNVAMNMINSEEILFRNIKNEKPLYIMPYAIANVSQVSKLNKSSTGYKTSTDVFNQKGYIDQNEIDKILSNIGLDIKYKPTQNSTLDLSLNTDFAQAEADDRIINLSRFSVSLPEKRLFFLENANLFSFDMFGTPLFYTRKIGIESGVEIPLIGGVRYTGNSRGWQYGLLNVQGKGVESSGIAAKNYGVARVRKQISGNGSYLGAMMTNQVSVESGNLNTSAGVDGLYWISDLIRTTYWVASSAENGKISLDQTSYGLRLNRSPSQGYRFDLRYRDFKPEFKPSLGFLNRPDTKQLSFINSYVIQFNSHPRLSSLRFGGFVNNFWISSTGKHQFLQTDVYSIINMRNGYSFRFIGPIYQQDRLFTPWQFSDDILIPADRYRMWKIEPSISSGDGYRYNFSMGGTIGGFYGGNQISIRPTAGYIFNRHLNVEFGANYNRIQFPSHFSSDENATDRRLLYTGRLGYAFTPATNFKAFIQYDNKSRLIGSNIRFRYNPKEGVNLYLIVNHNLNTQTERSQPVKPLIASQGITLKYSYVFN